MNRNFLLIQFILFFGLFQAFGQEEPTQDPKGCSSFTNVQQNCGEEGRIDLTFNIRNRSSCNITKVNVTSRDGKGQTLSTDIGPFSTSSESYTIVGAKPEGTACYAVELVDGEGRICCKTIVCVKTVALENCCDMQVDKVLTSCGPEGNVTIFLSGGTQPYGSYDANEIDPGVFEEEGLAAGDHVFTFRDANGCVLEVPFTIDQGECCGFKAKKITTSCGPDGNVTIVLTGGTPPYSSYDANEVDPGVFEEEGLDGGDHVFTFTDANGCVLEVPFTIDDDQCCSFRMRDISTSCGPDGHVTIKLSGGSPPYGSYDANEVDPGVFEEEGLDVGDHTFTFWDGNGCEIEVTFTIYEQPNASVEIGCAPHASVTVTIDGGSPPYDSDDGTQVSPGEFVTEGLNPGSYVFYYWDSNGCRVRVPVTIAPVIEIDIESNDCGKVIIQISGGIPPYFTVGDVAPEGEVYLPPDRFCLDYGKKEDNMEHTIIIQDINGCRGTTIVLVDEYDPDCDNNGDRLGAPLIDSDLWSLDNDSSSQSKVGLYPNPTSDILSVINLNIEDQYSQLRIINSSGLTLITQNIIEQDQVKLDISSIPSGIYFVEIINEAGEAIREMLVKN